MVKQSPSTLSMRDLLTIYNNVNILINGWPTSPSITYNVYNINRAWNSSQPLANFWPFFTIWLSKFNVLGQIYCTFLTGKPLIVYSNAPAFKEWPTNFKLLFQALHNIAMCNKSIFTLSHIVLYCSNKYRNILIYCNIVSSLVHSTFDSPLWQQGLDKWSEWAQKWLLKFSVLVFLSMWYYLSLGNFRPTNYIMTDASGIRTFLTQVS